MGKIDCPHCGNTKFVEWVPITGEVGNFLDTEIKTMDYNAEFEFGPDDNKDYIWQCNGGCGKTVTDKELICELNKMRKEIK